MPSLIQPLSDRPIDIVGDIHGEIDALRQLLCHLGYHDDGHHPAGRQLVFLGDLVNRGPDSPSVVGWVKSLVQADRAQCLLGNHEFNLLIGHRRAHSNWFYGEPQLDESGQVVPQKLADDTMRREMRAWFRRLPLALHRTDLRLVHACWNTDMVELARGQTDVVHWFEWMKAKIETDLIDGDGIRRRLEHQNRNPVTLLTSGPLERGEQTRRKAARVQSTRLVPWWSEYDDQEFCVFGHYSHRDGVFLGSRSSLCIDFGVGKRWTERQRGVTDEFTWKLAALRFPERELVFDDGGKRPCF